MFRRSILLICICILVLAACRKEKDVLEESGGSGPTPATLAIPGWVIDSVGMPMSGGDNPLTREGIALGRKLFHEKALSDNGTLSCANCHRQQHAFSDPHPFSSGSHGSLGTRNSMAVINLAWDMHFFWDGRRHSLEEQAHDPITNGLEMRNTWPVVAERLSIDPEYVDLFKAAFGDRPIDSTLVTKALAQFERTLLSFNSKYDRSVAQSDPNILTEQEQNGLFVFTRSGHCVDCHMGVLFTDGMLRNNGLDEVPVDLGYGGITGDPNHAGVFKVPTLRNIAVTGPYMHDARFNTLEEVVAFYATGVHLNATNLDPHMDPWRFGEVDLDTQEQADLVAFLRTLTDSTFLTEPTFGPLP